MILPRICLAVAALTSLLVALPGAAQSEEEVAHGHVQIPIDVYNRLIDLARDPVQHRRPVPAPYALGSATVTVNAAGPGAGPTGVVRVELSIEVFEDDWILIPVLPASTPVESVSVADRGSAVSLRPNSQVCRWRRIRSPRSRCPVHSATSDDETNDLNT